MAATSERDDLESTPAFRYKWDVFLSFRGIDNGDGFTENLYTELMRNGIRTYRGTEGVEHGDEIASTVLEAIEDSAASIAVISRNYASSSACLEELAKILECKGLILPVFYKVDPSDVRQQKGPFEEGFRCLEQRLGEEKVVRWRNAIGRAGGIAGWDSANYDDPELINSLVEKVLTKLSNTPMGVAKYPIGLQSRLKELTGILDATAGGVRVIGFYGMGGIGKTTLAKALYNKVIVHFKRRSFISNIRETLHRNGLTSLQNQLITHLSGGASSTVNEVTSGTLMIKSLIHDEPVLVVFDDVDDSNQINILVGNRSWFCEGSRIIITTRDKAVVTGDIVDELYEVKKLNFPESFDMFSYHAFGREKPPEEFYKVSKQVVSLLDGLPLALEVIGSYMFDKRRIIEWEDQLQKMTRIRPNHLQDVLEISFNGLEDQVKCIFLDISCLLVQMQVKREDAIAIFKGCGFNAEMAINVLTRKSLIKFIGNGTLWMHDQLRDMGRQIVQRENHGDPGKRSRVWDRDEIMTMLTDKKGTGSIQGLVLDFENDLDVRSVKSYWMMFQKRDVTWIRYLINKCKKQLRQGLEEEYVTVCTKSFEPMVILRLLQINYVKLNGNFKLIPAELKWLQWKGCPFETVPSNFCPCDLAVLDLSESKITKFSGGKWWNCYHIKMIEKLLVLDLHKCYNLTSVPNLSQNRVLEKLNLERCVRLSKLHRTVGRLSLLTYLNLRDCSSLVEFPNDVSGLTKLETLILSGCHKLRELPGNIGCMISLKELLADETAISKLPVSISHLTKLERLNLKLCSKLTQVPVCLGEVSSLRELILVSSALEELPDSIGSLPKLEMLSLMHTPLTEIPDSIGNLKALTDLDLGHRSIRELPASIGKLSQLKELRINRCPSLTKLPGSVKGLACLVLFQLDWSSIMELPDEFGTLGMIEKLELRSSKSLRFLPESIGNMMNLTTLTLSLSGIAELPDSIGNLERLAHLEMIKCKQLEKLPASFGRLKNLRRLVMTETLLKALPENFGMLSNLAILEMQKIPDLQQPQNIEEDRELKHVVLPMSFSNLFSLEELNCRAWKISGNISNDFEKLTSLKILNLRDNNFCSLPSSLNGLLTLKNLFLSDCKELKSLPPLPSSLIELDIANCISLEIISDLSKLEILRDLNVTNCKKIMDIPGLECLGLLRRLYVIGCNRCFPAVKRRLTKVALKHLRNLAVPASEIPSWFSKEIKSFSKPKNCDIKGIIIGVVVSLDQSNPSEFLTGVPLPSLVDIQAKILRQNKQVFSTTLYLLGVPDTDEDQLYLSRYMDFHPLVLMVRDGDEIKVEMTNQPCYKGLKLKKCGIHLVFENSDDIDCDEGFLDESQWSVSEKLAKFFSSL